MKAFIKFFLTTVGLVLILIGVVSILFLTQAQSLLTSNVENLLTEAFGSAASVKTVTISPTKGTLVLHGFALKNPDGFQQGYALKCERIDLEMRPETLLGKTPTIKVMEVSGAEIEYRYEIGQGTNIGALSRRLASMPDEDAKQFKVERLVCRDAKLKLSANFIPLLDAPVKVVAFEVENPHEGEAMTTAKAASIFLRSVLKETLTLKGLLNPVIASIRKDVDSSGD